MAFWFEVLAFATVNSIVEVLCSSRREVDSSVFSILRAAFSAAVAWNTSMACFTPHAASPITTSIAAAIASLI